MRTKGTEIPEWPLDEEPSPPCGKEDWTECRPSCERHKEDWERHLLMEWRRCPFACRGHQAQRWEEGSDEPMIGDPDHPRHLETRRRYCVWNCEERHFDGEEPRVYQSTDGVIPEPDPEITKAEDRQAREVGQIWEAMRDLTRVNSGVRQMVIDEDQPRGRPLTPFPPKRTHDMLCWSECTKERCETHRQQREATRALPARAEHALIPMSECPVRECWVHRWNQWKETHPQRGWAQCYDDDCERHANEKHLAGFWPAGPRKGDLETCDDKECTDPHPSQIHAWVRWQDCPGPCPYHKLWRKAATKDHQNPGHKDVVGGNCLDDRCQLHKEGHQTSKN